LAHQFLIVVSDRKVRVERKQGKQKHTGPDKNPEC
jgi:hypothetical protein